MRASCRRVLLLAAGLPLLSACATPAQTPRELGLGVFEPLLGAGQVVDRTVVVVAHLVELVLAGAQPHAHLVDLEVATPAADASVTSTHALVMGTLSLTINRVVV